MNPSRDPLDELLKALPRERHPARDLWPGIASGLRPTAPHGRWRAAAGVALAVVAAAAIWQATRRPGTIGSAHAVTQNAGLAPASIKRDKDAALRQAQEEMETSYRARLPLLPRPTRVEVEASLREIHGASAGLRQALVRDPANPLLQRLLTDTLQREADLYTIVLSTTSLPQPAQRTLT